MKFMKTRWIRATSIFSSEHFIGPFDSWRQFLSDRFDWLERFEINSVLSSLPRLVPLEPDLLEFPRVFLLFPLTNGTFDLVIINFGLSEVLQRESTREIVLFRSPRFCSCDTTNFRLTFSVKLSRRRARSVNLDLILVSWVVISYNFGKQPLYSKPRTISSAAVAGATIVSEHGRVMHVKLREIGICVWYRVKQELT